MSIHDTVCFRIAAARRHFLNAMLATCVRQAAGNTLWALAHMGAECLPARVWNGLLPAVARGGQPHPEHLRQLFQVHHETRLSVLDLPLMYPYSPDFHSETPYNA